MERFWVLWIVWSKLQFLLSTYISVLFFYVFFSQVLMVVVYYDFYGCFCVLTGFH